MPPARTIPPAKAVKTERTHEENQERAYIAASRRSDRSLEARVESARRASEIHKRRTGRSLRVTEQDVINEEMYEEEDDDLPLQYRRLTAHLQTGSADFNRRLSAYLTNHVAIRSALGQAITNSYAQEYPNAPQFANQQPIFPSPMLAHHQQQQMMQQPSSPSMHRQAPYPSPRPQQQGFQPFQQHRSASVATPQEFSGSSQSSPALVSSNERRSSMPVVPVKTESPDQIGTPLSPSTAIPQQRPSYPQGSFYPQQNQYNQFPLPNYDLGAFGMGYSPFSTALPAESQMLLGSALPNDPYTAMMMAGSYNFPGQFYDFKNNAFQNSTEVNKAQMHPSYDGINATLAPSALEINQGGQSFFGEPVNTEVKGEPSPAGTSDVGGEPWNSFIETDQWEMPSSSQ